MSIIVWNIEHNVNNPIPQILCQHTGTSDSGVKSHPRSLLPVCLESGVEFKFATV